MTKVRKRKDLTDEHCDINKSVGCNISSPKRKKFQMNDKLVNLKNKKKAHKKRKISKSEIDSTVQEKILDEILLNSEINKVNKKNYKEDSADALFIESKEIQQANNYKNKKKSLKKRKISNSDIESNVQIQSQDVELDEILLNSEINKVSKKVKKDDSEDALFIESRESKIRKMKFKKLLNLNANRTPISTVAPLSTGNKLRQRMLERLKAAQFRYLNEKLYTSSGNEAKELFQSDPNAFQVYHEGYQQQLSKWPVKPLDVIIKKILKLPKTHKIADMGCGEALLSTRVPHTVRSFDLVATAPNVEICDMAKTPLLKESMDVLVYCLALMGTELTQYLVEANRVLKTGGLLLIAEVESRFHKVEDFAKNVQKLGFKLKSLDKSNQVFYFMEFVKLRDPLVKKSNLPNLYLKPCLYKKR